MEIYYYPRTLLHCTFFYKLKISKIAKHSDLQC